MPISKDTRRAPSRALTIPLDDIVWADTPRPRTKKRIATVAVGAFVLGVATMADAAPDAPRLAPPGCIFHTVVRGDTVWRIAGEAGITLDVAARLNPHIPVLAKIEPGDQIATSCGVNEVQRATVQASSRAVTKYETETCYRDPGDSDRNGDKQPYECWTWPTIVAALAKHGATGEELVTLAAVTPGESGRAVDPCSPPFPASGCDRTLVKGDWGMSGGTFQVRSLISETGTGKTRDIERVKTLDGGAKSAVELCHQSMERGQPCGKPWTAWLRGHHESFMEPVRAVAKKLGLS